MTEVPGKLANNQTAYIKFENGAIEIEVEKGLFSKKRTPHTKIMIKDINSIELIEEENKIFYRLILNYGERNEVQFLSKTDQLIEFKEEISGAHNRYNERVEEASRRFYNIRKNNLGIIRLNLEFCDTLLDITQSLDSKVDWEKIYIKFNQLKLIQRDYDQLEDLKLHKISLEHLSYLLEKRYVEEFLNEVYELLDTIYRASVQASKNEIEYFYEKYHHIFINILFKAWDQKISKTTGINPLDPKSIEKDVFFLFEKIKSEKCKASMPSFDYYQIIIQLYYYIECLEKIQFSLEDLFLDLK
jgi:hypothetical protein